MGQGSSTFIDHAAATVDIPGQGTLVGRVAQDNLTGQLKSQRFAGIPFAQPPVGALRWKRPQPLPASFRYDSKHYRDFACQSPQPTNYALTNGVTLPDAPAIPQSEDCLYLNVWCPVQPDGARAAGRRPVLFFIHGGWLQIGNAHLAPGGDPSDLLHAAQLDAVVVTTAYRLNAFGFFAHDALRTEDPHGCTGNYGFWDQRAALEWVHHNIEHFGGDPRNITLSGLSAGAHSTHSQLMHEFDRSTRDASYTPIIRRVFLQSNAAIWPSKTVAETHGQLDELCSLLGVPSHLSDGDKIARLREVDALTLVRVLARMDMHTFRATRDSRPGAFVRPDWTTAMMDGRLGRWCAQHGVGFVIGECDEEEWVYRYINTPTDARSLVRQVHNYYTLPLVHKMLPLYGVKVAETRSAGQSSATAAEDASLYATLGVKPTATPAEIRTAYLSLVRQHHPDKLQQQGTPVDANLLDPLPHDALIRQLNHAYKVLSDPSQRGQYDRSLAAAAAASAQHTQPRISGVVDFEAFQLLEHSGAVRFSYACRCGYAYVLAEEQVHARVDVVGCDGCSENICVRYDDDEVGEVFGRVCADSQVYVAERMFVSDLLRGGLEAGSVLRYRINYRARVIDQALPAYDGVSHSFDDPLWWFSGLQPEEEALAMVWLAPWKTFIHGRDTACHEWYAGQKPDGRLIRVLGHDGTVSVEPDQRWADKRELIEAMLGVRAELVREW
ncbi:related to Acetylcholinesterase precursor [Sporisorium reilianum SRZ2]|uniref:Diphthamide biosynthesis protein 4 n=1 Tax=Sporisorium reilianum (strain SRZ2) TaxID=999809 RepID=E6ZU31_SPORE|nr:related to Acetylcholinesterase precursor [Sporisorium reilianum SRZ2]